MKGRGSAAYVTKDRSLPHHEDASVYRLSIPSVAAGASITLEVEVVFSQIIRPFPVEISQNDKQFVRYGGNSYVFSPYKSVTQSSSFKLPNSNIESFSRVTPTNSAEETLTYGPYSDVTAFSYSKIDIHYENNGPFLKVVELERIIEVSHWGNIVVEEHVHIRHTGMLGQHCSGNDPITIIYPTPVVGWSNPWCRTLSKVLPCALRAIA